MPRRRMDAGAEKYVSLERRREAYRWRVGAFVVIRWPGISRTLKCRIVGIKYWMAGTSIEVQCVVVAFPSLQNINGTMTARVCVTSDAVDPWPTPNQHKERR